jgi:hypothetical protein
MENMRIMKNQDADGETLRDLLEAALERGLDRPAASGVRRADAPAAPGAVTVGEVVDTHHPHLPGRVLVRWLDADGTALERWVQRERHLSLRNGDRVLLTLPTGWMEWVVTGALGREPSAPVPDDENRSMLNLQPGEVLEVRSHEGVPLLTLRQGPEGPVLELAHDNLELAAPRTLRLRADTVEIVSAHGGIDVRTEGDAVLRGRTIRLN